MVLHLNFGMYTQPMQLVPLELVICKVLIDQRLSCDFAMIGSYQHSAIANLVLLDFDQIHTCVRQ